MRHGAGRERAKPCGPLPGQVTMPRHDPAPVCHVVEPDVKLRRVREVAQLVRPLALSAP